jgi:TRAP-type C4-dicarboxylate transport system permease small subunit
MAEFYRRLCRAEAVIAGTFLVLMVALVFTGGVARMLHHPLNWTIDLATCLFAWACFLCADIAWRNNALISIALVTDRLAPGWRIAVMRLNYLLIAAFLVYIVIVGAHLTWVSRARTFQGIPGVSYSWVTASLPVGALLLLITTLLKYRALGRERAEA